MDQSKTRRHLIRELARVEEGIRRARALGQSEPGDIGLTSLLAREQEIVTELDAMHHPGPFRHGEFDDGSGALDVMPKDQAAIRLYEAVGYVRIGTIAHTHSRAAAKPAAVYATPPRHQS